MLQTKSVRALLAVVCAALLFAAAPTPKDIPVFGASPVADAAMEGDFDTVRGLLKQGVDVNAAQGDGMTALHWASLKGDVKMADMLLYAGANVKARTRLGAFSPLFLAAKSGSADMVEALLKASADANVTTSSGVTPLMVAAASGSADAVAALLDKGAVIDQKEDYKSRTALMFAAAYDRADVVNLLTSRGADVFLTTDVVDVHEAEKAWGKKHRDRRKEVRDAVKAQQIAQAKAEGREIPEEGAPAAAAKEPEKKNVVKKMFGWIPGVGGSSESEGATATTRRRRRRSSYDYGHLVGHHGGLNALHLAARQGNRETVDALIEAGADINEVTKGDHTSPLLITSINGHFDLALSLLERGADPTRASDSGATPLYAAINLQWAPKALYPQPRAHTQQKVSYLDYMKALLDAGADPNARLKYKIWYSGYNFDLSGVNESGATPFWRAAYGTDVDAMKLLVAYGADPHVPSVVPAVPDNFDLDNTDSDDELKEDPSGLPPSKPGDAAVSPLLAAAGVGYGRGFAANSHRHHSAGFMPAVKYLVDELGADINARDHEGYNALHMAASRGDTEMIQYLADKGTDPMAVSRRGQTTADMANGPVQRVQPFPEALALLESLGSINNDNCVSC